MLVRQKPEPGGGAGTGATRSGARAKGFGEETREGTNDGAVSGAGFVTTGMRTKQRKNTLTYNLCWTRNNLRRERSRKKDNKKEKEMTRNEKEKN